MLTAHGLPEDRVEALEHGADDDNDKPFSVRELVLRADAVARRVPTATRREPRTPRPPLRCGVIQLTARASRCACAAPWSRCGRRRSACSRSSSSTPATTYSRKDLLQRVWGIRGPANERLVDVAMHRLRAALGDEGGALETVLGGGYRLRLQGRAPA